MRRVWPAAIVLVCLTAQAAAQDASTPSAAPPSPPAATAPAANATPNATPDNPASPAPAPSSTPSPTGSAPAANLVTLVAADARSILGKKVSGAAGEDMGLVVDVLFDANKQPRAVVIDFGGFLGVGTRKIAVAWPLLQVYAPDSKTPLKLDLSRADVQSAPEYKAGDKTISVIAGPGVVAPVATPPATTPPASAPPAAPPPPVASEPEPTPPATDAPAPPAPAAP